MLDDLGGPRGTITVVGGGTAGKLWTRIVCDVLGKPLQVSRVTDSAYGAALLGLVGIGLYPDVSQALAGSRQELEIVSPDPERVQKPTPRSSGATGRSSSNSNRSTTGLAG